MQSRRQTHFGTIEYWWCLQTICVSGLFNLLPCRLKCKMSALVTLMRFQWYLRYSICDYIHSINFNLPSEKREMQKKLRHRMKVKMKNNGLKRRERGKSKQRHSRKQRQLRCLIKQAIIQRQSAKECNLNKYANINKEICDRAHDLDSSFAIIVCVFDGIALAALYNWWNANCHV